MPRGFGLAAVRRANFKMPPSGNGIAAEHFTLNTTGSNGTVAASDMVADAGDFSTFTVSTSANGPFTSSLAVTGSTALFVRAASPYPLVISGTIVFS